MSRHFTGTAVAASSGIVIGRVQKLARGRYPIPERHVAAAEVEAEVARFSDAVSFAVAELDAEREALARVEGGDPLHILDVHRMLLLDPDFIERTEADIRGERINAEWAVRREMDRVEAVFDAIEDDYLRERKRDIEQMGARILRGLTGRDPDHAFAREAGAEPVVLIAEDFTPAEIVSAWRQGLGGFVTEQGGLNAHAIIVARGIGMPGLMGASDHLMDEAEDGDLFILDGERSAWILNPTPEERRDYERFARAMRAVRVELEAFARRPSVSRDGHRLRLMANLEFLEELELANAVGAEGIGLYRTEFLFLNAPRPPDEEAQYGHYAAVVRGVPHQPVIFRLLDIGGDKRALFQQLSGHAYGGDNPALGLRGIRLLLRRPELLETQVKALLRAASEGEVRLLVPMVTTAEEIERVREMVSTCRRKIGVAAEVPVGAMIEVPAAAMIADELAAVSDFLSIGTNDLVQYTIAADRDDEDVDSVYRAEHPAVVQLIRQTVAAGKRAGIPVSVCGELAADPRWTERFLRLDMDALSMSPGNILMVRKRLNWLRYESPESKRAV